MQQEKEKRAEEAALLDNLRHMSDEDLVSIHRSADSLSASYFLRKRWLGKHENAPDNVLTTLVQVRSEEAKNQMFERYRDNLKGAPDEILVLYCQQEDKGAMDILTELHLLFVKKTVKRIEKNRYFKGYDSDDLLQEGVMGYFKAVNDFKIEKKTPFKDFAKFVIVRHLDTLIGKSNNGKNRALNDSFSYHCPVKEEQDLTFEQMLEGKSLKPEETCTMKETLEDVWEKLTPLEKRVLLLYSTGLKYDEIGDKVDKNKKAIDNTIQRIRKKGKDYMKKYIGDEKEEEDEAGKEKSKSPSSKKPTPV